MYDEVSARCPSGNSVVSANFRKTKLQGAAYKTMVLMFELEQIAGGLVGQEFEGWKCSVIKH